MSTVEIISQDPPTVNVLSTAQQVVEVISAGPQGLPGSVVIRTTEIVTAASVTHTADSSDLIDITALASAVAFQTPTGTPANGQRLLIRIKDDGTARAISWSSAFIAGGVPLPNTTTAGKIQHLGFFYAEAPAKWMLVASAIQP